MSQKRYRILYEDEQIIVADKPSGMLVIPSPKKETNTLTDLLNRELDRRGLEVNAYPCHRIDRETSGIVMYAKGKKAQALMMDAFRRRAIGKRYTAFVHGRVKKDFDTVSFSIYNRNKDRNQDAETRYRVIERCRDMTVVDVEPVTGRTNQIRVHFAEAGYPLVGESVFAFRKDFSLRFRRVALHARRLVFNQPVTGAKVTVESPLPDDMRRLLDECKRRGR